jgi:hypothetical protein
MRKRTAMPQTREKVTIAVFKLPKSSPQFIWRNGIILNRSVNQLRIREWRYQFQTREYHGEMVINNTQMG